MAHVYFDRVRETSVTTGTGDKQLAGAVSGYRAFSDVMADGDTTDVTQVLSSAFETTRMRYNSGTNTLTPLFVHESSNSNALVNFGAGTKDVFMALPARVALQMLARELLNGVSLCAIARVIGVAQFAGDAFADSFGALTYVDTAGATNLDSSVAGLLKPLSDAGGSETSATPGADAGNAGFSFFEQSFAVDNSRRVSKIGVHSTSALTFFVKIGLRNSSTNYDIVVNESFAHGGTGWEDKTLSSIYSVSAAGTYYAGVYCASNYPTQNASHTVGTVAGNVSGNGQTITETSSKCPGVRVTYSTFADNLTVGSAAITPVSAPLRVVLVARVKHVDTAVAGTDYNFTISRNGGSNYSGNLTLRDRFTDPTDSCHVIESDPIDVSGQTSPTTIKWKFVTSNNKNVELRDIYFRGLP